MTATLTAPPPGAAEATGVRDGGRVLLVPIGQVQIGTDNPRKNLGDLSEMTESIRVDGILVPLLVRHRRGSRTLTVVDGQRRLLSARAAGLTHVPVVNRGDLPPAEMERLGLLTNIQRKEMEPIEESRVVARLLGDGLTQAQVAAKLSKSLSWVGQRVLLLELPDQVQTQVAKGDMTVAQGVEHARQFRRTGRAVTVTGARAPLHFGRTHRLYNPAVARCNAAEHQENGRIGGACGSCWEAVIVEDALGVLPPTDADSLDLDLHTVESFIAGHDVRLNHLERKEVVHRLHAAGQSDAQIALRLGGISGHAVLKIRQRSAPLNAA